jgi:hypothetical protein
MQRFDHAWQGGRGSMKPRSIEICFYPAYFPIVLKTENQVHNTLIMAPNPDISATEEQVCDRTWEAHVGGQPNFFDLKWAVSERWWYRSR